MIVTPISNLLVDRSNQELIMPYTDAFECRDRSINSTLPRQKCFHCEIQPIHELKESDFMYLEKIKNNKIELDLISFHMASCFTNPLINDGMYIPNGRKYLPEEMLKNSFENISRIKKIFGTNVKIAVENNNYFPTEAYDYITDGSFISDVVYQNNIFFLYDISHAQITAHYKQIPLDEYYNSLPLDKLLQVHISKLGYNNQNKIIDAHELPSKEDLDEIKELNKKFKIQYFTIEYYRSIEGLINLLLELRNILYG